ncbi:glucose dehydrogenase [Reticulibacter mediterranei]|uniref:Glucose dehydrogenase n=1 Tax=Reticulibacter mediterranei TaxID=2778369 RepID=A0A8J3IDU1_9CHLR|nr:glucose 1-dehydrogenase [Reticulibacter mediterranei]GHO90733.1 glucose dehydrogenase [Reticulibacter mediterranei]
MKAVAVFPASREVKLIDQEEPTITQPDQVKIRILDIGICGTDKEICTFVYGSSPPDSDYLIIGHEALGEVVQVGSAVTGLAPGDLVVPSVRRPCPHSRCRPCRTGHQDFCITGDFTERGIKEAHGYLTEFVVDEARYMHPVPRHLRDIAILVEPLTVAQKAEYQLYGLTQRRPPWIDPTVSERTQGSGHTALVLGAGPVGLLGAMALRTTQFKTFVYSREKEPDPRIAVTKTIGATYISSQEISTDRLEAYIGPIDLVYEAAGHSLLALEVLRTLGPNGIYILTGVPGLQTLIEADPAELFRDMVLKNQVVLGTVNAGPHDFVSAIADLETFHQRWPDAVRALMAERTPIEQAVERILGRPVGIKSIISFDINRKRE